MNLQRLQQNFEALASEDPLWTVLSDNSKKGGKWDVDAFYESGVGAIQHIKERLQECQVELKGERALDFGCGVGRLSFALSPYFQETIGVDISQSMIKAAEKQSHRGENCRFVLNTGNELSFIKDNTLDLAYSDIVFQHIAPRYSRGYFLEIARALKPGGVFVFQLPSHLNPMSCDNQKPFRLWRKRFHYLLKSLQQKVGLGEAYFEMNAIRRETLIRYITERAGLEHLKYWDYPAAGPNWQSYLYLFRKPSR